MLFILSCRALLPSLFHICLVSSLFHSYNIFILESQVRLWYWWRGTSGNNSPTINNELLGILLLADTQESLILPGVSTLIYTERHFIVPKTEKECVWTRRKQEPPGKNAVGRKGKHAASTTALHARNPYLFCWKPWRFHHVTTNVMSSGKTQL